MLTLPPGVSESAMPAPKMTPTCRSTLDSVRSRETFQHGMLYGLWTVLLAGLLGAVTSRPADLLAQDAVEPAPAAAEIDLSTLGHSGVRYEPGDTDAHVDGTSRIVGLGRNLGPAGDVNGDSQSDLLLGADGRAADGSQGPGRAWIILGGQSLPARLSLARPGGPIVELRSGLDLRDRFGALVASAGDVDGDGHDDVLVGMPSRAHPDMPQGAVFLVLGSPRLPSILDLFSPSLQDRVVVYAASANDALLGFSGSGLGDIDGDGFDDFAVGVADAAVSVDAIDENPDRFARRGRVYIRFGGPDLERTEAPIADLDRLASIDGLVLEGLEDGGLFGLRTTAAGDVDGDGFDDFLISAPGQENGTVWLFFGGDHLHDAQEIQLSDAPSRFFTQFRTSIEGARLGTSIAGGRDATGDGLPDLLFGMPGARNAATLRVGLAVLVPSQDFLRGSPPIDIPSETGHLLRGTQGDELGRSVSFVPDRNGDGRAELLLGAPGMASNAGRAYLVNGQDDFPDLRNLASIAPPFGQRFVHSSAGSRFGEAVAGIEDHDADGLPDLVFGAPGFAPTNDADRALGTVFELYREAPRASPRDLACERLSGRRVRLSWVLPRPFTGLRIFRDGQPISPRLPGDLQFWVDSDPGEGRRQYVVEADGDESLRSAPCSVELLPLPVRDLRCQQLASGEPAVRVAWRKGDEYDVIAVYLDGEFHELVDADRQELLLDIEEPGLHRIEVVGLDAAGRGEAAVCSVRVAFELIDSILDLQCVLREGDGQVVELSWTPADDHEFWIVERNGQVIGRNDEPAYIDPGVPVGQSTYRVFGIDSSRRAGLPASCTVDVVAVAPLQSISGRVIFDDSLATAVQVGFITLTYANGEVIARAQPDGGGNFEIPAVDIDTNRALSLVYTTELIDPTLLDLDRPRRNVPVAIGGLEGGVDFQGLPIEDIDDDLVDGARLTARVDGVEIGQAVTILLPLPVLAMAPTRSDARRWAPLREALVDKAMVFSGTAPGGVVRGTLRLADAIEETREILQSQFGSAPGEVDLVAFGFTGLAARLYQHTAREKHVSQLILLGTPNLGTPRALIESRGEFGTRPQNDVDSIDDVLYIAAEEQTDAFLGEFNERITSLRGARLVVVAGVGGSDRLDTVLGCDEHDNRLCRESAKGVLPPGEGLPEKEDNRQIFRNVTRRLNFEVDEDHETLGAGPQSLAVLLDGAKLGSVRRFVAPEDGDGGGPDIGAPAENGERAGDGGIAGLPEELVLGKVVSGKMPPGGQGRYQFQSDTSDSVVIILRTESIHGTFDFRFFLPNEQEVTPLNAQSQGIEYEFIDDGEGSILQLYTLPSAQIGDYQIHIDNNSGNPEIKYSLESRLESPHKLLGTLASQEIERFEDVLLTAEIDELSQLPPGIDVTIGARVLRPDGSLDLLTLRDDGLEGDLVSGDGISSVRVPASGQPGYHTVALTAEGQPESHFERADILPLLVLSDIGELGEEWESGADDLDSDTRSDILWATGYVTTQRPGQMFVLARLESLGGDPIANAGTIVTTTMAESAAFRIDFDGYDIFGGGMDGPYQLAQVEVLDAAVGFVRSDLRTNVHTTAPFSWSDFARRGGLPFVRGDTNSDGVVDISDGIRYLRWKFDGTEEITCLDAADADRSGELDVSDGIVIFNFLFLSTSEIPEPYPLCNEDTWLDCEYYPYCE